MKSWRKLVAMMGICCFLGMGFLLWVMYGPVLDDKEFDNAIDRAMMNNFPDVEIVRDYPFSTIKRQDAVARYVKFAQLTETTPVRSQCEFYDIDEVSIEKQSMIKLACQYGFFSGSNGSFEPESYMTKGTSLVALMKGMFPNKQFDDVKEYWLPYIAEANRLGITKREPGPYVNYLITRYELVLQLWRAYQRDQRNEIQE